MIEWPLYDRIYMHVAVDKHGILMINEVPICRIEFDKAFTHSIVNTYRAKGRLARLPPFIINWQLKTRTDKI